MPPRIRPLDELRADLRRARARFTVRDIAREAGVGRTTLNLLLAEGDAPAPTTATARKLSAWLDRADAGDGARAGAAPPADTASADDVPAHDASSASPSAAYWQGVAEATRRMLDVAGAQLETLIDSGVLTPRAGPASRAAARGGPTERAD